MASLLEPVVSEAWPTADRLIDRFGSLPAVFAAPSGAIAQIAPQRAADWLRTVSDAWLYALKVRLPEKATLASSDALREYLILTQGYAAKERVRIIFLNLRHSILSDEIMGEGTLDAAPFYVREIIARALELNAAAMILVHNHPSGNATPSKADIEATRRLARATRECEIHLLDHLIVAHGSMTSLRSLGMM